MEQRSEENYGGAVKRVNVTFVDGTETVSLSNDPTVILGVLACPHGESGSHIYFPLTNIKWFVVEDDV